ncbi:MAG: NUDIX domain-containing protein [Chloroflexi bacterium]|nr:NUDIX domain-containing protein [Chloroflexota bacterium]
MPSRVEIIEKVIAYKKFFFKLEEARFKHELYNGEMSDELLRLNLERGDSAAVVMYDTAKDSVILTEQFRYPTYEKGPGWILEIPAGTIEKSENRDPTVTLRREIMEEIGYSTRALRHICTFYVSPGGTSERIHLYYTQVSPKDKAAEGGGIIGEGEDIRVLTIKLAEALGMIAGGKIVDAKTIIGLQWLQLNRNRLQTR